LDDGFNELVKFLEKGSKSPSVQKLLFKAVLLCHELKLRVVPIYLAREDSRIQIPDVGSKELDTDNWLLSVKDFQELEEEFR